jgi:hypothetical protein
MKRIVWRSFDSVFKCIGDFFMRISVKMVAASVVLALASAAASAAVPSVPSQPAPAPIPGTDVSTGSGLIVSIWDSVRGVSLVDYVGLNESQFLPGNTNATPDAGLVLNFGTIAGYSSVFGTSDNANIQYTISSSFNSGAIAGRVLETTLAAAPTGAIRNNPISSAVLASRSFTGNLNANCANANPCTAATNLDATYAGVGSWAEKYGNNLPVSAAATVGTAMGFYLLSTSSSVPTANGTVQRYGNATGFASWLLGTDGSLTYSVPPPSVPLPAAVWLLLSGMVGFGTVARRRKEDASVAA